MVEPTGCEQRLVMRDDTRIRAKGMVPWKTMASEPKETWPKEAGSSRLLWSRVLAARLVSVSVTTRS